VNSVTASVAQQGNRAPLLAGRGLLFAYTAAIVYASLNPFYGWRMPEAILLFSWPKYWSIFDLVLNVLAYIPFGAMVAGQFARRMDSSTPAGRIALRTLVLGSLLSIFMELLQTMLPQRVSSPFDVFTNALGTIAGAAFVLSTAGQRWQAHLMDARDRWMQPSRVRKAGLILCLAWLFAQLNPLVPLFDAGEYVPPRTVPSVHDPYDPWIFAPFAFGTALNACAFALFLSLVLRPGRRLLIGVALMVAAGFVAKAVMAALMVRAPQFAEWLSPAAVTGVAGGGLAFLLLHRLPQRWRALATALLFFAGTLLARITADAGTMQAAMKLLNWPHGHVATFAGLTHWVYEAWPVAAFAFAAWIFLSTRPME
jgi:VanZ family protein